MVQVVFVYMRIGAWHGWLIMRNDIGDLSEVGILAIVSDELVLKIVLEVDTAISSRSLKIISVVHLSTVE